MVDQDEYQPYQTRRGDTVAQAEAALEEIKALGKFSRTNLSRLEKVMRDILQGANTGELARVAALSPCRSWYYLLFGLAILIEADVLLTVKQIVYICQSWLDVTFQQFSGGIAFEGMHGQDWLDFVGEEGSALALARKALIKSTSFAGLTKIANVNGKKKIEAMVVVLIHLLKTKRFKTKFLPKAKQKKLLKALQDESFTTAAVKERVLALNTLHRCTTWEIFFWYLIQESWRGNTLVLTCYRAAKARDGRAKIPPNELNEFIRNSITYENVAAANTTLSSTSTLGVAHCLKIAKQQVGSFAIGAVSWSGNKSGGGSNKLTLPSGFVTHYRVRPRGKLAGGRYAVHVEEVGTNFKKKGEHTRGLKNGTPGVQNGEAGTFFRRTFGSIPKIYQHLNLTIPPTTEKKGKKRKRNRVPKTAAEKAQQKEEKHKKIKKTMVKNKSSFKHKKTKAKIRVTNSAKGLRSYLDPIRASVAVRHANGKWSPKNAKKWTSYKSVDHFIESIRGKKITDAMKKGMRSKISMCLRGSGRVVVAYGHVYQ